MTLRARARAVGFLFSVASGLIASCDDLPDLPVGTCGNSIVEREIGEECDWPPTLAEKCATSPDEDCKNACAPAGDPHECQVLADAKGICPVGSYVGADQVCRRPSGRFQAAPIASVPVAAIDAETGDLDGDGAPDLVVTTPLSGSEAPSVTYFQAGGGIIGPYVIPFPPAVGKLTDDDLGATPETDAIDDLVLAQGPALVTLRGASGPTFLPKAYTPFTLDKTVPPGTPVRLFIRVKPGFYDIPYGVAELPTNPPSVVFAEIDASGFLPQAPTLTLSVELLKAGPEDLIAVDLITDEPGEEIVAATTTGIVISAPDATPQLLVSLAVPNIAGLYRVIGPAVPTIGVLTSDRKLRLLRPFDSLTTPAFESPLDLPPPMPGQVPEELLAVGDIDGDGELDAVMSDGVFLHVFVGPSDSVGRPTLGRWTQARIVDLNASGRFSVVALPNSSDVDVLLPGSEFAMNPAVLSVGGVLVDELAIADFDGDGVDDVLVATEPEKGDDGCEDTDDLYLAFGRPNGRPEEPINVGQLRGVRRLTAARLQAPTLVDAVYDAGVQTRCAPAAPEPGSSAGLLLGATSRAIFSPFLPFLGPSDDTRRQIVRVAAGELGRTPAETETADHPDVAVLYTKEKKTGPIAYLVARMPTVGDAEFSPITEDGQEGSLAATEIEIGSATAIDLQGRVPALDVAELFEDNPGEEVIAWLSSADGTRLSVTGLIGDVPSKLVELNQPATTDERHAVGKIRIIDVDRDGVPDVVAFLLVESSDEPVYAWWFKNTGTDLEAGELFQVGSGPVETPSDIRAILPPTCVVNAPGESPCDLTASAVLARATSVTSCAATIPESLASVGPLTESCPNVVVPSPSSDGVVSTALGPDRILALLVADVDLDGLEDLIVFRAGGTTVHRQCSMSEVNHHLCVTDATADTAAE